MSRTEKCPLCGGQWTPPPQMPRDVVDKLADEPVGWLSLCAVFGLVAAGAVALVVLGFVL